MTFPRLSAVVAAVVLVVGAGYVVSALRSGGDDDGSGGAQLPAAFSPESVLAPPVPLPQGAARSSDAAINPAVDPAELDRVIAVVEERVATIGDAANMAFLGRLYLTKARPTADIAVYGQAREVLQRALEIAPDYQDAKGLLALASFSLHDFATAGALATEVLDDDPNRLDAAAVAADAALAVGDHETARAGYERLAVLLPDAPAIQVRLARLEWLEGDPERAAAMAAAAVERARAARASSTDVAWYLSFQGSLALDAGRYEESLEFFQAGLEADPGSPVALGGLAEATAALGKHSAAITLFEQLAALAPDPGAAGLLGDLHWLAGDVDAAEAAYAEVEALAREAARTSTVYNEELAHFLTDHERKIGEALELATAELMRRRDIFALDVYAWALYRNGRYDEARAASDEALQFGTPAAELWYHAGLISASLGDGDRAIAELERALALSPEFHPLLARHARQVLDQLRSG